MKVTIRELKRLISDQVERNMRWSAGFFGGGGASNSNPVPAPPGLGPDNQDEEEIGDPDGEEQEKSQPALRVDDRAGGPGRPAGNERDR